MAKLKGWVSSLEDVAEEHRGLYVQDGDRYKLDAEGVEDVKGLKSALDKEREEARRARERAEKFKDIDPDRYRELMQQAEDAEKRRLEAEGDYKALTDQLKAKHEKDLAKERARGDQLLATLEEVQVVGEAASVMAALGVTSTKLLMPHVKANAKVAFDESAGKYVVHVLDANGRPRLAPDGNGLMTVRHLVEEMREDDDFGLAFPGTGKSGPGAPGKATQTAAVRKGGTVKLSRADARNTDLYEAAKKQALEQGVDIEYTD